MKRIPPLFIVLLLIAPAALLYATGNLKISGNILGNPTATFDSGTSIGYTYTDNNGAHTSTTTLGSSGSSGYLPVASLSYSGATSFGPACQLYILCSPALGTASANLGGSTFTGSLLPIPVVNPPPAPTPGTPTSSGSSSSSTYQLGLSFQAAKLVGGGDFSGEQALTAGNGWTCVTTTLCNPLSTVYTFSNSTSNYQATILLYRYALLAQLQLSGDHLNAVTGCTAVDGSQCTILQVNSLNKELNQINTFDAAKGTVLIDVNGQLIISTPADKYTIVNAFVGQAGTGSSGGGNAGCVTSLPNGGTASINPCVAHSEITDNLMPFTYSQPINVNSYSPQQLYQLFVSNWNPNAQFQFSYNLQPKYTAICGTINCQASSTQNCLTAGTGNSNPVQLPGGGTAGNACLIQADYGITVQLPIVFDIASVTTKPVQQATNNQNTGATNVNQTSAFSTLTVHVQDSILGFGLSGMNVGLASSAGGGGCSSVQSSKQTDSNGNVQFTYLTPGSYQVCASGGSGALMLIFISVGLVYSPAQTSVSLNPGSNTASLVLQGNFVSVLTTVSLVLIAVGIIIFVVLLLVSPSSLTSLGLGGLKVYRSYKRRR